MAFPRNYFIFVEITLQSYHTIYHIHMASSSMVIQPQLQIVAQQQKFGSQSFIHSMAMLLGLQLLEYLPIEQQHKSSRRRRRRRNGMGEVAHRKLESSRPISFNVERKLRNFSASCYSF